MSIQGLTGSLIFNNPIDGSLEHRALRRSGRDVPHTLVGLARVPIGRDTWVTTLYRLRSGLPYAYTVNHDVNADGSARNDLAFIPRDSGDISLSTPGQYAALDRFISTERCLRESRGRLMTRNSCRNPAVRTLDLRLTRALRLGARRLELDADLFNALNAVNRRWGLVRETVAREDLALLNVTGWDAARNRPVYAVPVRDNVVALPSRRRVVSDASRWRVQVGARFTF